jgi:hypothetical protein
VNRKLFASILPLAFLAIAFLTGCGSNSVAPAKYSYYLSGRELSNNGPNFYAVAGSVTINSDGKVLSGEQDYNDGKGNTSPNEPDADKITAGTLTVNSNGQGTLTLTVDNTNVGVDGVETLGVQFANNNHALVIQYDGTATSSGSMDLQTLPNTFNGSYAFNFSGVDTDYDPVVLGGVFTTASNGTTFAGVFDQDDAGEVSYGNVFPEGVTVSSPDSSGRGTITGLGTGAPTLAYYIIGPEAARLIDVNTTSAGVGSAFGQGTTTFSNSSLTNSVFGVDSSTWGDVYVSAGQIAPSAGAFTGVADADEEGFVASGVSIAGTYSVSNVVSGTTYNGYSSLTMTTGVEDVANFGIYMTDPTLNLNDPNNTTGAVGGALVVDLDEDILGTGVLVPQTDTSTADFTGNYVFGAQDYWGCEGVCEFDLVGQGTVTNGALTGSGLVSDPYGFFADSTAEESAATFSGSPVADAGEGSDGRYTLNATPLAVTVGQNAAVSLDMVIYQASGTQLFWLNEDSDSLSLGPLEQQGSLSGLPQTSN